jgi:hypothetical protein
MSSVYRPGLVADAATQYILLRSRQPPAENVMSKGLDKKKEDKKKPEKTLKEKRAAKKEKKTGK